MSDGISEWHKLRWEQELKSMTKAEREKAQRARPRAKPKREIKSHAQKTLDDLTDEDGVIYGEPPFWKQAWNWAVSTTFDPERKMLQIAICSIASFWLGYWAGA